MIICAAGGSRGRLERRSTEEQPGLLTSAIQQFQVTLAGTNILDGFPHRVPDLVPQGVLIASQCVLKASQGSETF